MVTTIICSNEVVCRDISQLILSYPIPSLGQLAIPCECHAFGQLVGWVVWSGMVWSTADLMFVASELSLSAFDDNVEGDALLVALVALVGINLISTHMSLQQQLGISR